MRAPLDGDLVGEDEGVEKANFTPRMPVFSFSACTLARWFRSISINDDVPGGSWTSAAGLGCTGSLEKGESMPASSKCFDSSVAVVSVSAGAPI